MPTPQTGARPHWGRLPLALILLATVYPATQGRSVTSENQANTDHNPGTANAMRDWLEKKCIFPDESLYRASMEHPRPILRPCFNKIEDDLALSTMCQNLIALSEGYCTDQRLSKANIEALMQSLTPQSVCETVARLPVNLSPMVANLLYPQMFTPCEEQCRKGGVQEQICKLQVAALCQLTEYGECPGKPRKDRPDPDDDEDEEGFEPDDDEGEDRDESDAGTITGGDADNDVTKGDSVKAMLTRSGNTKKDDGGAVNANQNEKSETKTPQGGGDREDTGVISSGGYGSNRQPDSDRHSFKTDVKKDDDQTEDMKDANKDRQAQSNQVEPGTLITADDNPPPGTGLLGKTGEANPPGTVSLGKTGEANPPGTGSLGKTGEANPNVGTGTGANNEHPPKTSSYNFLHLPNINVNNGFNNKNISGETTGQKSYNFPHLPNINVNDGFNNKNIFEKTTGQNSFPDISRKKTDIDINDASKNANLPTVYKPAESDKDKRNEAQNNGAPTAGQNPNDIPNPPPGTGSIGKTEAGNPPPGIGSLGKTGEANPNVGTGTGANNKLSPKTPAYNFPHLPNIDVNNGFSNKNISGMTTGQKFFPDVSIKKSGSDINEASKNVNLPTVHKPAESDKDKPIEAQNNGAPSAGQNTKENLNPPPGTGSLEKTGGGNPPSGIGSLGKTGEANPNAGTGSGANNELSPKTSSYNFPHLPNINVNNGFNNKNISRETTGQKSFPDISIKKTDIDINDASKNANLPTVYKPAESDKDKPIEAQNNGAPTAGQNPNENPDTPSGTGTIGKTGEANPNAGTGAGANNEFSQRTSSYNFPHLPNINVNNSFNNKNISGETTGQKSFPEISIKKSGSDTNDASKIANLPTDNKPAESDKDKPTEAQNNAAPTAGQNDNDKPTDAQNNGAPTAGENPKDNPHTIDGGTGKTVDEAEPNANIVRPDERTWRDGQDRHDTDTLHPSNDSKVDFGDNTKWSANSRDGQKPWPFANDRTKGNAGLDVHLPPVAKTAGEGRGQKVKGGHTKQRRPMPNEDDAPTSTHFFSYFIVLAVLCVAGYVIYHNKQRIMAYMLEGDNQRGSRRRSPSTSGDVKYSRLDVASEERISPLENKNYIY